MHLSCDLMDLLIELKKSMLKLLNEISAISPVHIQFFHVLFILIVIYIWTVVCEPVQCLP